MNGYLMLARAVSLAHWICIFALLAGVFLQVAFPWYGPVQIAALGATRSFIVGALLSFLIIGTAGFLMMLFLQ